MTGYYAPAARVLTVVHLRNPAVSARSDVAKRIEDQSSTIGDTACGLPMLCNELWQLIEREDGDVVCAGCLGEPAPEQGALL